MFSFTGGKCRLRPFKKEDKELTLNWRNEPEIIENIMGYRFPVTEVMEEKWYESILDDQSRTRVLFAIEDLKDDALVGYIHLNQIDWISKTAYFGITIGEKSRRGKGIGTDAMDILFRYAFEYLNVRKIYLEVAEYNHAAKITYEKYGFNMEGILKEHFFLRNQYHDVIVMSLFSSDFYTKFNDTTSEITAIK
ncbi:GNAT family N-acetyltransferase [Peribacillus sp. SCS-155]|uniref:GNAT family N-acetyltransferase n=1 Tax=Peribacillus sedimenti TaxID=3115297 RepID=UPI0039062B0F